MTIEWNVYVALSFDRWDWKQQNSAAEEETANA